MKFNELNITNGTTDNPCEMLSRYLLHEEKGGTLVSFLKSFDFDTREEIEVAIIDFLRTAYNDAYMRKKHLEESNMLAYAVRSRARKIYEDQSKMEKYPVTTSGELWHGGYSRKRLNERTQALFDVVPDAAKFANVCEQIKETYGLNDIDVEKLHFFVEQVKDGARFPNSLRRMLYLWGNEKKTGKTTTARTLVCLLNGDEDPNRSSLYETTLQNEMQIGSFKVPKISECNACMMDECFYADMGKTYADFKRFITSANGRARLPFGQEFEWTGAPNYIATSNDPLRRFIKDWGDRRYLAIEFKEKPKTKMSESEIVGMWRTFVQNSTRTLDWSEWAERISPMAEEKGERAEIADEFESELRKSGMLDRVLMMRDPANKWCADNRITLKVFVDMFADAIGSSEAQKRRQEIEAAVISVYGGRYSNSNYWLLTSLKETAQRLKNGMYSATENETITTQEESIEDDGLPF